MKRITFVIIFICCLTTGCSTTETTTPSEPSPPPAPPASTETVEPAEPIDTPVESTEAIRKPANLYRTNNECINIIKEFDGLRLNAYSDQRGNWFIGYGHSQGVTEGMTITEAEAEQFLRDDLIGFEQSISRMVEVDVTENEFSAMVCLTYNIGPGGFAESTVLRKVNQELWSEAADAILLWNKVNGEVNSNLVSRREKERALFLKMD